MPSTKVLTVSATALMLGVGIGMTQMTQEVYGQLSGNVPVLVKRYYRLNGKGKQVVPDGYEPYVFDGETGERMHDRFVSRGGSARINGRSALQVELRREGIVDICFPKYYHIEGTNVCEVSSSLCSEGGWELHTGEEAPFKEADSRGRFRGQVRGGLHNCGLTFTKAFEADTLFTIAPNRNNDDDDDKQVNGPFQIWIEDVTFPGGYTPLPMTPRGHEQPLANTLCPEWLREDADSGDAYTTVTDYRDGRNYLSWHPLWHPVYWCSMGHEHGSDPAALGVVKYPDGVARTLQVPMGFVAHYNDQQNEPDIGFKGYHIDDPESNVKLYIVSHTTTSSEKRQCARFHTVFVNGIDKTDNRLVFNYGFKADFGASRNRNTKDFFNTAQTCEDGTKQEDVFPGCRGRKCATRALRGPDKNKGYEQWSFNFRNLNNAPFSEINSAAAELTDLAQLALPFDFMSMKFDTRNPVTGCANDECSEYYHTGQSGSKRTLHYISNVQVIYDADFDQDGDGWFVTNEYGFFMKDCNFKAGTCLASSANKEMVQYLEPNYSVTIPKGKFGPTDSWGGKYEPFKSGSGVSNFGISNGLKLGAQGELCKCFDDAVNCNCFKN